MKINRRKCGLVFLLLFPIAYIFSYPFITVLFEELYAEKYAYIIYEPVEYLRYHSRFIYSVTEKLYDDIGGYTSPERRYYFATYRKRIVTYEDYFVEESYRDGLHNGLERIWYINGVLKSKVTWENSDLNGDAEVYFENGKPYFSMRFKNDVPEDGTYTWHDQKENVLGVCSFKKGLPFTGTAVLLDMKLKPESPKREPRDYLYLHPEFKECAMWHLVTFKDGKIIEDRLFRFVDYGTVKFYPPPATEAERKFFYLL